VFGWLKKRNAVPEHEQKVRVYVNPLIAMLYAAERKKGAPLTEAEVLHIRDTTVSVEMTPSQAQKFYASLDAQVSVHRMNPDHLWAEWQEIRDQVR
jgi:hypothetical protein